MSSWNNRNLDYISELTRLNRNQLAKLAGIYRSSLTPPISDWTLCKVGKALGIPEKIIHSPHESSHEFASALLVSLLPKLSPQLIFAVFDLLRTAANQGKKMSEQKEVKTND